MKWLALFVLLSTNAAAALDLTIPNSSVVRDETDPQGRVRLPEAPYSPGTAPASAEGEVHRRILRVPGESRTPLQLIEGLRTVLRDDGFEEIFACANAACGGFDFRFQLDIIGEPDMHVDLGNYVYVLMRSPVSGIRPHSVALLASRTQTSGFVHITTVSPVAPAADLQPQAEPGPAPTSQISPPVTPAVAADPIATLLRDGHLVLGDLVFPTGSSELDVGPYASLDILAAWLSDNPAARIVLVGHTDSVGSLAANTALSQKRAASVSRYLVTQLGADPTQIQSDGAGFLAPVASNLTSDGQTLNRRVEVVLLSLDQ